MSGFSNIFSPQVIRDNVGQVETTIQGTSFHNGRPTAGYIDGQFAQGDLQQEARRRMWEKPWVEPPKPEPAVDVMGNARKGV